ncbi:MAG: ABC transporter substrate-binding protein [Jatrophihabitantaceae bacterium]
MNLAKVVRRGRARAILVAGLVTVLTVTACSSSAGNSGNSDKGPIVLGGVFTKTPFPFGNDAQLTVQQVFKEGNAQGGINGRKIVYNSGDDNANPSKAAGLAREYVGDGAVAFVGSASFVDCGSNQAYYLKNQLASISGVGVDPFCFTSPNIESIELSPYSQVTAMLYYASKYLHDTKLCYFQPVTPGSSGAVVAAIKNFTAITGQQLLIDDHTIPTSETSFTPELLRAKSAGCDAILYGGGDTIAAATLKDAKNQGMSNVDFLYVSVSYTSQLAKAAGGLGLKVFASTGSSPYTVQSPETEAWRKVAVAAHAKQTAFSEAGYIAAEWMVSVLKSIKGPITRSSVTAALRKGTPYQSSLIAVPLVFGPGKSHDRQEGINVMTLKNGTWQVAQAAMNVPSSGH